jgi:hypothetical protein
MTVGPIRYSLRWLAYELLVPVDVLQRLADEAEAHYRPFYKFRRGKPRLIDNPDRQLSSIQAVIRDRLLEPIPLSDIVHGCVKGRSTKTTATVHTRVRNLASIDVKRFYASVTNDMVYEFFATRLRVGPEIARILTRLTTRQGHLPHGSPVSHSIANLILSPVDKEIERIASDLALRASRYVDNIDLGGVRTREAFAPIIASLRRIGLAVAHGKTENHGPRAAHVVAGLNVNGKRPSATRRLRDDARVAAYALIAAKNRGERIVELQRSVRGRVANIAMTNPGAAKRLRCQLLGAGIDL